MKKFKLLLLGVVLCLPFMFLGCSNSKNTSLNTPSIIDVEDGKIIFSQVSNADYYTILLNNASIIIDHNFNQNVEIVDDTISFDANSILVDGTSYSIKVQANSNKKKNSKFSTGFDYQHGENVPTPLNIKILDKTLTWDNVPTASYYIVKAVTPTDKVIFDKNGNAITIENSSSIKNAQLSEFICNQNNFSISDFVTTPGEYSFYVASVFAKGGKLTMSDFAEKQSYVHSKTLNDPTLLSLNNLDEELYLTCVIDSQANALSIKAGSIEKTVELNNSNASITKIANNYLNINLNSFFENQISSNNLNLSQVEKFEVQSKFISNENKPIFLNSQYSSVHHYQLKQTFSAPELKLEFNNKLNKYIASWNNKNTEKSNYTLILFGKDGLVQEETISSATNSVIIEKDFISVAVMINSNNNFEKSKLSNFVSKSNITSSNIVNDCVKSDNTLFWNSVNNAYYIVEIGNNYHVCTSNSIYYENGASLTENVKITAIINGFKHATKEFNISSSQKLKTPEVLDSITTNKTCNILINPVANAVGYHVYVKNDNEEFTKIDYLFINTLIDLSDYLYFNNMTKNIELKIQAVGAYLSPYQNSELSDSLIVAASAKLATPSFVAVNNVETPIFKTTDGNTSKYVLKFMGVKGTAHYNIQINDHTLKIDADVANEQKIYEKDVSSIISAAGKYVVKINAVPVDVNTEPSEFNSKEFILKQQLSMVEGLQVEATETEKTLKFKTVDNAEIYQIRIVKESDSEYESKLQQNGLNSTFRSSGPVIITNYLTEKGNYHIYIASIAGSNSEFYYDSAETKIIFKVE